MVSYYNDILSADYQSSVVTEHGFNSEDFSQSQKYHDEYFSYSYSTICTYRRYLNYM